MQATSKIIKIALDVMGGEKAPLSVIEGASNYLQQDPDCEFIFYGNEKKIKPIIEKFSRLDGKYSIIHTDQVVKDDDKPSQVIRRSRDSSMWKAIEAVKEGVADAVVSGGNTGALMAMAKIQLRMMQNITRPAIVGLLPTIKGRSVMLDLGANSECDAMNLFQFAVMGDAFAKVVLGKKKPSIGVLNIGVEDMKGNDVIREASSMLKSAGSIINYYGFIEGHNIAEGKVDVVVTDGFTGNIALKTAEGTGRLTKRILEKAYKRSIFSMVGFLLSRRSLLKCFEELDYRSYNGAMFLGLNGIVVKSHGSIDGIGFCNAIKVAVNSVRSNLNEEISKELAKASKNLEMV